MLKYSIRYTISVATSLAGDTQESSALVRANFFRVLKMLWSLLHYCFPCLSTSTPVDCTMYKYDDLSVSPLSQTPELVSFILLRKSLISLGQNPYAISSSTAKASLPPSRTVGQSRNEDEDDFTQDGSIRTLPPYSESNLRPSSHSADLTLSQIRRLVVVHFNNKLSLFPGCFDRSFFLLFVQYILCPWSPLPVSTTRLRSVF